MHKRPWGHFSAKITSTLPPQLGAEVQGLSKDTESFTTHTVLMDEGIDPSLLQTAKVVKNSTQP